MVVFGSSTEPYAHRLRHPLHALTNTLCALRWTLGPMSSTTLVLCVFDCFLEYAASDPRVCSSPQVLVLRSLAYLNLVERSLPSCLDFDVPIFLLCSADAKQRSSPRMRDFNSMPAAFESMLPLSDKILVSGCLDLSVPSSTFLHCLVVKQGRRLRRKKCLT